MALSTIVYSRLNEIGDTEMNITTAQQKIDGHHEAGLISTEEAKWYSTMIRRTERYGHKMHWSEQKQMRENLLRDFS